MFRRTNAATGRQRQSVASNSDRGVGERRAARCAAERKDLDNDHTAAAARAGRAMIGHSVGIGCVVRLPADRPPALGWPSPPWRVRYWSCSWRSPAARSGGCDETPLNVEQKAPDELVGAERHCAVPRLPAESAVSRIAFACLAMFASCARPEPLFVTSWATIR
jgi:hypothetical protein